MLIDTKTEKEATDKIGKEYVDPAHIQVIQHICERHGFIATFRDAGKYSIAQIQAGKACKPHDVLEKSIKEKSIDKFVDETLKASVTSKVTRLKLWGLIGHWGKNSDGKKTLLGIRTIATHEVGKKLLNQVGKEGNVGTEQTYNAAKLAAQQKARNKARAVATDPHYGNLQPAQKVQKLQDVRLEQQYQTWVSIEYLDAPSSNPIPIDALTGDYDMHEMIHAKGQARGGRVVSTSSDEGRFADLLNQAIFEAAKTPKPAFLGSFNPDPVLTGTQQGYLENRQTTANGFHGAVAPIKNWPSDVGVDKPTDYRHPSGSTRHNPYALIQHGPQHAYGAYIFAGGEELLVESLLAYDVPVAAFGIPKDVLQKLNGRFARKKEAVETGPVLIQTAKELEYLYQLLGVHGWDHAPKQFDDYLKFARLNLGSMLRKQEEKAKLLRSRDQQNAEKQLVDVESRRAIWDYWILALLQKKLKTPHKKDRHPSKVDELKAQKLLTDPDKFDHLLFASSHVDYTDTKSKVFQTAWYAQDLERWQAHVEWVFENFITRSLESFYKSLKSQKEDLEDDAPDLRNRRNNLISEISQLKTEKISIPKERVFDIGQKESKIESREKQLEKVKQELKALPGQITLFEQQMQLIDLLETLATALKDDLLGLGVSLSLSDENEGYGSDYEAYGADEYRAYETKAAFRTPARSFAAAGPTYLNGMQVLFDQAVPVAPVVLIPKQQIPVLGGDTDDAPHPDGPPPALPRRVSGRQRLRYANRPDPLQRYRKTKQIEGYGYPEQDF